MSEALSENGSAKILAADSVRGSPFAWLPNHWLRLADAFYRSGALVFGGGHVALPLLQSETVARGWLSQTSFMAGYGAAQAMPGPLSSFAAYLGMVICGSWFAGLWCLLWIFLPFILTDFWCIALLE